ncbi:MAG: CHAP domain-containing protein [Oscillospiraceae bacterium]|nr:CHAP domain-containing protein [Oscillospiraceae bacterium]
MSEINSYIEKIIVTAEAHVGVTESPRGSNNVLFNTHYYGREVSGEAYPWCVTFVWDVFRLAGLSSLFYGGEKTASSTVVLEYARRVGAFRESGFRRGDVALFSWTGSKTRADHLGIIAEVSGNAIRTIEGNTSLDDEDNGGAVMERVRKEGVVIGAYRPAYPTQTEGFAQFRENMARYMDPAGTGMAHSAWADAAINEAIALGIFHGDGEGGYGWQLPVTREEAAVLIMRILDLGGDNNGNIYG